MIRPTAPLFASLILVGCAGSPDGGTSVGNPGRLAMTAAPGTEVTFSGGSVPVGRMTLAPCGDGDTPSLVSDDVVAFGASIEVPVGSWCSIRMETEGPATFDFLVDSEGVREYAIGLDFGEVELAVEGGGAFSVAEGQAFVFELGSPGWLDADDLEFDADDDLVEDEALLADLADVVTDYSGLFADSDGDGVVDGDERDSGAVAGLGGDDEDEDEDGGGAAESGCGASSGTLAALPLLVWGRRRELATA